MQTTLFYFKTVLCIATVQIYQKLKYMNWTLKTEKQEMNYLNYINALCDCFEFLIAQVDNMLPNQAMLPDWAMGPDWWTIPRKVESLTPPQKYPGWSPFVFHVAVTSVHNNFDVAPLEHVCNWSTHINTHMCPCKPVA